MRAAIRLAFVVGLLLTVVGSVPAEVGPGYFASSGTELVRHVPLAYDSSGGRVVGSRFYMTTSRDLRIYDIADPEDPQLLGTLAILQEPQFSEEDLDTNGRIALVESMGTLNVIDVTNPTAPAIIGTITDGPDYHTVSCVLDCTYAYGSNGLIVDLRDPTKPAEVGDWTKTPGLTVDSAHDVTEVAPGIVVTSSQPLFLLDARSDPAKPKYRAFGINEDGRFIHANRWPRLMQDRFLLAGGETFGPSCGDGAEGGSFMVWDTSGWEKTHRFTMVDDWRVSTGIPTQGDYPYGQFCAHWFQEHPTFADGGLVAMAWYESGVRFLQVSAEGTIEEVGYFIAAGSVASAAYWITDRIVYVVDYFRGFDVIRYGGPITHPESAAGAPAAPTPKPAPAPKPGTAPKVDDSKTGRPLPGTGVGSTGILGMTALIGAMTAQFLRRSGARRRV